MKFSLSKESFAVLKNNFECAFDFVKNIVESNDSVSFEVENVEDFRIDMIGDIIHKGMDNQDVVNELGKKMSFVHDTLMYTQLRNNS